MSPQSSSLSNGKFHYCISGECYGHGKARLRDTSDPAVTGPFLRATQYLGPFPPQSPASPSMKWGCSSSSHTDVFLCSVNGREGSWPAPPCPSPLTDSSPQCPLPCAQCPLRLEHLCHQNCTKWRSLKSPFPYSNRSLRIRDLRADVPCPGVSDPTGRPPSAGGSAVLKGIMLWGRALHGCPSTGRTIQCMAPPSATLLSQILVTLLLA